MKSEEVVIGLAALAQESRLALFRLLVKRGPEGYTPTQLGNKLNVLASTLSFHLKELQHAGLIEVRRDGRHLVYSTRFDRIKSLVGFLTEECCSQAARACDADCNPIAVPTRRRSA